MKKRIIVFLAAVCVLLFAGCGGGGSTSPTPAPTAAPTPAPAPTAAPAPETAAPAGDGETFVGTWEFWGMMLRIRDDGTWRLDNEGEEDEVSSGAWKVEGGTAILYFNDGVNVFSDLTREGDILIDEAGNEILPWEVWLAQRPEQPPMEDIWDDCCGLWKDMEQGGCIDLMDIGFWSRYDEQGALVMSGCWDTEGSSVLLYDFDDALIRTLSLSVSGDLLDGSGGMLVPADASEIPWAAPETYVGAWQFMNWEGALLDIRDDGTWTLWLEGETVDEGAWEPFHGFAEIYQNDGYILYTLKPDVGGLSAEEDYLIPADGVGEPGYDPEADAAAWAEIDALSGLWYADGDFSAEEYLSIFNGEWSFQSFSSGEPEELACGTIVPSAGEPHAFYAVDSSGESAYYFRYSAAEENEDGLNVIYWDNDALLFVLREG